MKYKIRFIDSQFGKTQLNDYIANCNHISNIYNLFNQNLISIEKLEPPFGDLRSEHLMKALKIAEFFNNVELISDIPLLNKIYSKFANKNQSRKVSDKNNNIAFYKSTFPNLKLSATNWGNLINKINLETYIGIDIICEKAIIIWNSIIDIKTTNSCSGHLNANRYFSFSNFNFKYDADKTNISKVSKLLESAFSDFDSNIFKIDVQINDNLVGINFFQIPPINWIKKNNKIPITELCNEMFVQFKSTFNTDEEFENFDINKYSFTIEAVEFIRKNLWKYANQTNINLKITDNEDDFFWIIFRTRCLIFEETYKDYYISEEAINNIKLFWKKIEDVGIEIQ